MRQFPTPIPTRASGPCKISCATRSGTSMTLRRSQAGVAARTRPSATPTRTLLSREAPSSPEVDTLVTIGTTVGINVWAERNPISSLLTLFAGQLFSDSDDRVPVTHGCLCIPIDALSLNTLVKISKTVAVIVKPWIPFKLVGILLAQFLESSKVLAGHAGPLRRARHGLAVGIHAGQLDSPYGPDAVAMPGFGFL